MITQLYMLYQMGKEPKLYYTFHIKVAPFFGANFFFLIFFGNEETAPYAFLVLKTFGTLELLIRQTF